MRLGFISEFYKKPNTGTYRDRSLRKQEPLFQDFFFFFFGHIAWLMGSYFPTGDQTLVQGGESPSLNHWTTRKFSISRFLKTKESPK